MRIGIIADRLGLATGGLETYERGLLQGLIDLDTGHDFEVYCSSRRAVEANLPADHPYRIHPICAKSAWLRFAIGLPLALVKTQLEIVHACFVPPLIVPQRLIVTVHDLFPFVHPHCLPWPIELRLKILLRTALRRSVRIIANSETTKQDIINWFQIDPARVKVIHLGVDKQYHPCGSDGLGPILDRYNLPERYILYVGRIEPRKNIGRLLQAYRWLRVHKKIPHRLVLVGRIEPWGRREIEDFSSFLSQDVFFTGYVPLTLLPYIYRGADAFVFPSLFEGFGLPPLEAMACGTPVVASRIPSICEVVQDAAILVDPHDQEGLAAALLQILEDERLRQELRERGLRRAALFSWKETARKTLQVYEEVAG